MNNKSNWIIRDCAQNDAQALLDFWRQAEATPSATDTLEDVQRMISTATVLVAEADGNMAGSIFGVFDGWRANIYRLAVDPSYRRRGIARALVAEVEKRLAQQGAKRFSAIVEGDHPWAMAFGKPWVIQLNKGQFGIRAPLSDGRRETCHIAVFQQKELSPTK